MVSPAAFSKTTRPEPLSQRDPMLPGALLPGPIAAFDVGGTSVRSGLVHPDGSITHRASVPTPRDERDPAGAVISYIAGAAADMPGALAIGVVVPGIVDAESGIGVVSANLGWKNAQFRDPLEQLTGLPVGFNHDVTAAAMAEARFGAARGKDTFVTVVIGTGIAAGLYVDGEPYLGNGYAGEIGHTVIDPMGPLCSCGARGCLEQIASAAAIARRYSARTGLEVDGARGVLEAVHAGDETAQEVWQEAITALAAGLRQLATSIAPQFIVIGGGLQQAGETLLGPLRREITKTFSFYPTPTLTLAECGQDAGLLGSALIGARAVTS